MESSTRKINGRWETVAVSDEVINQAKEGVVKQFLSAIKTVENINKDRQSKNIPPLDVSTTNILIQNLVPNYHYCVEFLIDYKINTGKKDWNLFESPEKLKAYIEKLNNKIKNTKDTKEIKNDNK